MKKNILFMFILLGIVFCVSYIIKRDETSNSVSRYDSSAMVLTFSEKTTTLEVNDTLDVSKLLNLQNDSSEITYISNDDDVALVTQDGMVTAKSSGIAIVSAIDNLGRTANMRITVADSSSKEAELEKIILNDTKKEILIGQTYTIKYELYPSNASSKEINYKSSNSNVASVNDGIILAKNIGNSVISICSSNEICASINITVVDVSIDVSSIKVYPSDMALSVNESKSLYIIYSPSNVNNKGTTIWTSSNNNVAKVENGKVIGVSAGSAYITATVNGKTSDSFVTVENVKIPEVIDVKSVTLNKTNIVMESNTTLQLSATVLPSNATNKKVTYTSTNGAVFLVTSTGLIKAIKAGTATLSACTANSVCARTTVTVKDKETVVDVKSVTLNKTSIELEIGETFQANCTLLPLDNTNKKITYISLNSKVFTTTQTGLITAVSSGTSTFKACSTNNICGVMKVTVKPKIIDVQSIYLNVESLNLKVSETKQLRATILPMNATNKNVIWSSSNTKVLTVSNTGLISAISSGKATITVMSNNGKTFKAEVIVLPNNNEFKYGDKPQRYAAYCTYNAMVANNNLATKQVNKSLEEYIDNAYMFAKAIGDIDPKRAQVLAAAYFLAFNPYCKVRYMEGYEKAGTVKGWWSNWTYYTGIDSLTYIKWSYYQVFEKNYESSILGKYKKQFNRNGLRVSEFIDIVLPGDVLVQEKVYAGKTRVAMVLNVDTKNKKVTIIHSKEEGIKVEVIDDSKVTNFTTLSNMSRIFN